MIFDPGDTRGNELSLALVAIEDRKGGPEQSPRTRSLLPALERAGYVAYNAKTETWSRTFAGRVRARDFLRACRVSGRGFA